MPGAARPLKPAVARQGLDGWTTGIVCSDFAAGVTSRQCPATNPDVASQFARADGPTVRVHSGCEPRFHRLWDALARAVGLSRS